MSQNIFLGLIVTLKNDFWGLHRGNYKVCRTLDQKKVWMAL